MTEGRQEGPADIWDGVPADVRAALTVADIVTLSRHVRQMRETARRDNEYNGLNEGDKGFWYPESWGMAQSLEMAAEGGGAILGEDAPYILRVQQGINDMTGELDKGGKA